MLGIRYFVRNTKRMSISELQLQLHKTIDAITDREKLEAIYTLLKGTDGPYKAMSKQDYVAEIDEACQQIKDGKFVSVEDLENESENW